MIFTHILVGLLVGALAPYALSIPVSMALVAGAFGGGAPDLDLVLTHRRSLHFPILFTVFAVPITFGALLTGNSLMGIVSISLISASTHSLMDILGGGKEMRPWNHTDDRAVYDHVNGRWIRARRYVHDGSVGDLALAGVVAAAVYVVSGRQGQISAAILLGFAVAYFAVRRRITEWISDEHDTFSSYVKHLLRMK